MFSSKKFYKSADDVPAAWIFKYYLGLEKDFDGRSIRVRSYFNDQDKTPSMFIYLCKTRNEILFKCYSSGKSGDAIQLVQELFKLSYFKACEKINADYFEFCKTGKYIEVEMIANSTLRWSVIAFEKRNWCKHDAEFWLQYNIGSSLLEKYNVVPFKSYTIAQVNHETGEIFNQIENSNNYSYGYFAGDELHKVYNPKNKRTKFFLQKSDYMQGTDQLENHDTLVIASSLKDVMAIKSLGLTVDCIAPNSENSKITSAQIEYYKSVYK